MKLIRLYLRVLGALHREARLAWILAIALPIYVGFSRLYQGMHHPTDLIGSVMIAVGSLLFGLLACLTASAVGRSRTRSDERRTPTRSGAKVAP